MSVTAVTVGARGVANGWDLKLNAQTSSNARGGAINLMVAVIVKPQDRLERQWARGKKKKKEKRIMHVF